MWYTTYLERNEVFSKAFFLENVCLDKFQDCVLTVYSVIQVTGGDLRHDCSYIQILVNREVVVES